MELNQHLFVDISDMKKLPEWYFKLSDTGVPDVDGYIHSPHAFSVFFDIGLTYQTAQPTFADVKALYEAQEPAGCGGKSADFVKAIF